MGFFDRLTGSANPDPFAPRMPEVDPVADAEALFTRARREAAAQRSIAIVTPGRMVGFVSIPQKGAVSEEHLARVKALLPSEEPLKIAFIGYTAIDAFTMDKAKAIPFLGGLIGLGYAGHDVLVFEGHPSVFEAGVKDCGTLIVDGAMTPFLQPDWTVTAWRAMRPGGRIFVHNRQTQAILPVIRSSSPPGWRVSEPDGEGSYVNCLLLTLARGPVGVSAQVVSGAPLPNLAELTTDPGELEWISGLPFRYDQLNSDAVLRIVQGTSGMTGTLKANLADSAGRRRPVTFEVSTIPAEMGRRGIRIARN